MKQSLPERQLLDQRPQAQSFSGKGFRSQNFLGQIVGSRGEQAAAEFLLRKGYEIVERNWSLTFGELDIIARKNDELIFVEVKSRLMASEADRYLFDTITFKKQTKLRQLVQIYMDRNYGQQRVRPRFRIDVIGVIIRGGDFQAVRIRHLINAV